MGKNQDWSHWILQKNAEFTLDKLGLSKEQLLRKAFVNKQVPKGACNCGAHHTSAPHMHYDWCDGLDESEEARLQRAIANFNNQVKPEHIRYLKDAGHVYADGIDHPAAQVEFSDPKHQNKFDDHVNDWLSQHDESGSDKYPHDY